MVSNASSGRRVQARMFEPPSRLAPSVAYLWTTAWDLRDQPPHRFQILGDPTVDVVFEAGRSRVVGVWTRMWERTLEGRGRMWAIKLRGGSARRVLARELSHYTDRITLLGEVWPDAAPFEAEVLASETDEQAVSVLSRFFDQVDRADHDGRIALATALVQRIHDDPDLLRVDQLTQPAGLSVRGVQRLFRAYVGASPKWVIRRRRLQEAAEHIETGRAPDLADLALTLGYADQAHLARDFKEAVGMSLRAFEAHLKA